MPVQNPFGLNAILGNITQWDGVNLGTPTAWGTAANGNTVIGVNAELFGGNTAITATGTSLNTNITNTVTVTGSGGTFPVTQSTSPWIVAGGGTAGVSGTAVLTVQGIAGGTAVPISGSVTVTGTSTVNVSQWGGTGTTLGQKVMASSVPVVVASDQPSAIFTAGNTGGATAPSYVVLTGATYNSGAVTVTNGQAVALQCTAAGLLLTSNTPTGTQAVDGALTNNNAAPTATLLGVLPAIAETAYTTVTYTTGDMVLPVTDLHGALNQDLQAIGGTAVGTLLTAASTATVATQPSLAVQLSPSQPQLTNPLNVTAVITSTNISTNVNEWDGTALGAPSAQGTLQTVGNLISTNSQIYAGTTALAVANTNCLKTDQSSQAGTAITTVPTAFGTGSPSGNAPAVQAALYIGTTAAVAATTAGVQRVGIAGSANAVLDAVTGAATAPANGLATLVEYVSTTPALTTGQSVMLQSDQTGAEYVNTEGRKKTYSSYVSGTGVAGVNVSIPGNATTVLRIVRVEVSISTSGTAGAITASLIKTSAAPSGGTSASMTVVPHDSGFAAADSTPLSWFAGVPTPGTPVGTIRGLQLFDESATVTGSNTWLWDWGMRPAAAVVLRGTAQTLEINLSGVVSTQTLAVSIEWTEE